MYTAPHQSQRGWQTTVPPARDATSHRSPRAIFLLASTGLEPREVLQPWEYLTNHGFFVEFATWNGKEATADSTLLNHIWFGSKYTIQARWKEFVTLTEWISPRAWGFHRRTQT
ncbi:hypothetical protein MRB53_039786 [Persea americana]|nr:hypothetical protein MRB53_039786 [Persea americana]